MSFWLWLLLLIVVIVLCMKLYITIKTGWCKSKVCLVGKTAIITGANAGIGYETALDFAKRGCNVILACRDKTRAEKAQQKIIEETNNPNVTVEILNFASLQSVREFAEKINKTVPQLDILVNNAGIAGVKNKLTDDGLDLVMQVNYFGHVLLTHLLLDLLKKSGSSRIINVSSIVGKFAKLDPHAMNRDDGQIPQYSKSKLCQILFTIKLARELARTHVTVYSLHPGAVHTEIWRTLPAWSQSTFRVVGNFFLKTCEEGAQTTLHCALQKGIEQYSGEHFDDCEVVPRYKTVNSELMNSVWEETHKLLKLNK